MDLRIWNAQACWELVGWIAGCDPAIDRHPLPGDFKLMTPYQSRRTPMTDRMAGDMIPFGKRPRRLPTVLAVGEVNALLRCTKDLKQRTIYASASCRRIDRNSFRSVAGFMSGAGCCLCLLDWR